MANVSEIEIRCGQCGRLLGKGDIIHVEIKCPRCGTLNQITKSAGSAATGRPGASQCEAQCQYPEGATVRR